MTTPTRTIRRYATLPLLALVVGAPELFSCAAEFEYGCPDGTVQTAGGGDVKDACTPVGELGGAAGAAGAQAGGGEGNQGGGEAGGVQAPVCTAGATRCANDVQETCGAEGTWGEAKACDIACDGAGACVMPLQLAVSPRHACVRLSDGTVRCWGNGNVGQLGNGTGETQLIPKLVPQLANVTDIVASFDATCARLSDGTASCWGYNILARLQPASGNVMSPEPLGLQGIKQLSLGSTCMCVLTEQSVIFCKGLNNFGQLGNVAEGPVTGENSDVFVPPLSPNALPQPQPVQVVSAYSTNFSVTVDGRLFCWGVDQPAGGSLCDGNGETDGFGTDEVAGRPSAIASLSNVRAAFGGYSNACVVRGDGKMLCWGRNVFGQLGRGTKSERETPGLVSGIDSVRQVALGDQHTCATTNDGRLFCWGSNADGQLGKPCGATLPCQTDPDGKSFVPVPTQIQTGVNEVRAASNFTCALTTDAKILCWGSNVVGQLGNGTLGGGDATPKSVIWK
jgi:alpha-tubulin suppressor-like RCC1 family protein